MREDNGFLKCIKAFCGQSESKDAISSAGKKALVYSYAEKEMTSLTDCERQSFATRWQKIQLPLKFTAFPPTTDAAKNTTCSEFIVRSRDGWRTVWTVDPEKWGWCLRKGQLEPKTMDSPVAPDSQLKLVRC